MESSWDRRSGCMEMVDDMSDTTSMPKSPMEVSRPPVLTAFFSFFGLHESRPGAEISDAVWMSGKPRRYFSGSDLPELGGPTIMSQTGAASTILLAAMVPKMAYNWEGSGISSVFLYSSTTLSSAARVSVTSPPFLHHFWP